MDRMTTNESSRHPQKGWKMRIRDFIGAYGDLLVWTVLLLWLNRSLFSGSVNTSLIYASGAVHQGQWWRVLTYPLVHLSAYHLLLDGGAFLLLYHGLAEQRRWVRLLIMAVCSASGLGFGIWLGSASSHGLSGLSGIAHGLMAYSAIEMVGLPQQASWGWISLVLVTVKSLYELASGRVLFAFLHMGLCGDPVAACHAGGVLGGIAAFAAVHGAARMISWRRSVAVPVMSQAPVWNPRI